MNNTTIKLKVYQRLNKLSSKDYDNIHDWQILEAFNKGVVAWCRRNLQGTNLSKTGDEATKRRIDDLQVLLKTYSLKFHNKKEYYESELLPTDYFEWKRISADATHGCCNEPRKLKIYLAEEANVDMLLSDAHKKPNFKWAETFCTMAGNKIKIFTNNEFELSNTILTYYQQPRRIEIKGVSNPYTGDISTTDVECQFKDDLVELFIDEAVKILAGDVESLNVQQISDNSVESNN